MTEAKLLVPRLSANQDLSERPGKHAATFQRSFQDSD